MKSGERYNEPKNNTELVDSAAVRLQCMLFDKTAIRDRGDVLLSAFALTMGNRNKENGPPVEQMDSVAAMWQQLVTERNSDVTERQHRSHQGAKITAADACVMMVLLKVSRYIWGGAKVDDFVDMAGYASMAHECVKEGR